MAYTKQRVLVVFVDALGTDQLERLGEKLGSLPYRRGLRGILGYSSGALPTLLTGKPPAEHGRMCLFSARSAGQRSVLAPLAWLGLLPRIVHERAAFRRVLGRLLAQTAGLTGYVALHRVPPQAFRWLDLPEREDLFTADTIGGVQTFLTQARQVGLGVYAAPWQLPEPERWVHAHTALDKTVPDLAFLYAAELDAALHRGGNAGRESSEAIERISAHIDRARVQMSRGGADVLTLIVGDHGMADIHTVIDPRPALDRLGRARTFVDSTMMRFWGDNNDLSRARSALDRLRAPGRWLEGTDLEVREVPTRGEPYGRAVFLLDEGALFAPSFLGGRISGMHGYDLGTHSSIAGLASDAPLPTECLALSDVAAHVRVALGITAESKS